MLIVHPIFLRSIVDFGNFNAAGLNAAGLDWTDCWINA